MPIPSVSDFRNEARCRKTQQKVVLQLVQSANPYAMPWRDSMVGVARWAA